MYTLLRVALGKHPPHETTTSDPHSWPRPPPTAGSPSAGSRRPMVTCIVCECGRAFPLEGAT